MNVYLKKNGERTSYLGFRITADEKQAIDAAAQDAHEDVSDYVRKAIRMRMQIMSEHDEETVSDESAPDIHAGLYAAIRKSASANDALYEHLACGVRDIMPSMQAQDIEDALNMTCVSLSKPPLETLLLIHEFLTNCAAIASRRK